MRLSPSLIKSPSFAALSYSVTAASKADNVSVHRPEIWCRLQITKIV